MGPPKNTTKRQMCVFLEGAFSPGPQPKKEKKRTCVPYNLLGQWLNFKLFGITYLVGKISRSNFYFRVPFAK